MNLAEKLIAEHLVGGRMSPGDEIALRIDQTLTQDATGTLVMLELEAMGLERTRADVSVQYVDHNLIQADHRNADDHLFLQSACSRFGLWYSRPGNGVSHPLHMRHFGRPGRTLLGSDSHTCAAGSLGMLAIGTGGLEVALAMAGEPYSVKMPAIWGVRLSGAMPLWVSAKDVILEMLRRHGVDGGVGRIIEYYGPGVATLTAMDRHVIANMGAELGATTTVFPTDRQTRQFLEAAGRGGDAVALEADEGATYDVDEALDLSRLEPLIAMPSSPGNVVPVRSVAGEEIFQAYIGSSANPGDRDFAIAALMVRGRQVHPRVSFDINPTTREQLELLINTGLLGDLIRAGARLHQAGCNGCIGMGQAPATGRRSLRTTPRNFPGRSGTQEDSVYLCSPETATASALTGAITDPRDLGIAHPSVDLPAAPINRAMFQPPLPPDQARQVALVKGPGIAPLPALDAYPDAVELPILLTVGDDLSTDEILPAGARVLPYRSDIPKISEFTFAAIDPSYVQRARQALRRSGHAIVAGKNYGQGSSREHAALATRYLGLRLVLARSFARIHWQNLVNFGVLPLRFERADGGAGLAVGDVLVLTGARAAIAARKPIAIRVANRDRTIPVRHDLSPRQVDVLLAGGLINWVRRRSP
jgi:aconitate hydratase